MANPSNGPKSLAEAIEKLEETGTHRSAEVRDFLDKELKSVKEALKEIKPHLEEFKEKATAEVKKAKHDVEEKVKENPWWALGIVGLIAFFVGFLIGWNKRDR